MDCNPPGASVHGIHQARILEWVVIPFSRGSSWFRDRTWVSCFGRQIFYHLSHQESPLTILKVLTNISQVLGCQGKFPVFSISCCPNCHGGCHYAQRAILLPCGLEDRKRASLVAQMVKNLPAMWETQVRSLGLEDALEKAMATHFSILAWRIPWTEQLGEL